MQLIYRSQPFGFDEAILAGILVSARRNNARDGITGALVCRHDIYLQLLEGEAALVEAAYARILLDDRHQDAVRLWSASGGERLFPAWAMRDDPARSWLWSPAEVAAGVIEQAPPTAVRAVFERIASEAG